jgi:hypothetical protein
MRGSDGPVVGDDKDRRSKLFRMGWVTFSIVCIIGAFLMMYAGLFMINGVEIATEEFDEAYWSEELFVLHGTIEDEREVTDEDGAVEYRYFIQSNGPSSGWPVTVSSDHDLGDNGDEVYLRVEKGGGFVAIPETYSLKAVSKSVHPIVFWIGLGLVVIGIVGLAITKRSGILQARLTASS